LCLLLTALRLATTPHAGAIWGGNRVLLPMGIWAHGNSEWLPSNGYTQAIACPGPLVNADAAALALTYNYSSLNTTERTWASDKYSAAKEIPNTNLTADLWAALGSLQPPPPPKPPSPPSPPSPPFPPLPPPTDKCSDYTAVMGAVGNLTMVTNAIASQVVTWGGAVPLLAQTRGYYYAAIARYGKGKVFAIGHENMLEASGSAEFVRAAASWLVDLPSATSNLTLCYPSWGSKSLTANIAKLVSAGSAYVHASPVCSTGGLGVLCLVWDVRCMQSALPPALIVRHPPLSRTSQDASGRLGASATSTAPDQLAASSCAGYVMTGYTQVSAPDVSAITTWVKHYGGRLVMGGHVWGSANSGAHRRPCHAASGLSSRLHVCCARARGCLQAAAWHV
jgi:hypothetical protein